MLAAIDSKEKLFFISFAALARHNHRVTIAIGAFLNATGILLGGIFGLALRKPVSARAQYVFPKRARRSRDFFRTAIGLAQRQRNLSFVRETNFHRIAGFGSRQSAWKTFGVAKNFQQLRTIRRKFDCRPHKKILRAKSADGFNACAILFCAAPLGILGAVADGLSNYFYFLAVKAVMDGLAMTSFVKIFRWPAALSAFPVFIFLGAISFACQFYAEPFLDPHDLAGSVNAAAGFIAIAVALVIFEIRKVELANYLPALAIAPVLAWLLINNPIADEVASILRHGRNVFHRLFISSLIHRIICCNRQFPY